MSRTFVVAACLVAAACSPSASESGPSTSSLAESDTETTTSVDQTDPPSSTGSATDPVADQSVEAMLRPLPETTTSVAVLDIDALTATGAGLSTLQGDGIDPALAAFVASIEQLAPVGDLEESAARVLLGQTADRPDRPFLVLSPRPGVTDLDRLNVMAGYETALLPGGLVVAGDVATVDAMVAAVESGTASPTSPIAPYAGVLDGAAPIAFAIGLPGSAEAPADQNDLSLRHATAMTGAFDIVDGTISGELAFHTPNAAEFVERFNTLDLAATASDPPVEQPLTLGDPVVPGVGRVVVTIPPTPLAPSAGQLDASRNLFKKLFVGMEAYSYASNVGNGGERPWLDFVVRSEAEGGDAPSPGSVYIRWEFRDQAAVEAFERDELPAGFRLAPTRFVESDAPEGEYFLALNLYNAGGGSIVSGARAEWDVFVHPPAGADPDAGERPRFMVVDVLAEEVNADPGNLLTPAQPLSHELIDGRVVSSVGRFDGDVAVPVFTSSFPVPDPATAEVARFTREMAIGNDYIYWAHGVSDRVIYNATTFNHDAYLVDVDRMTFTDETRWAKYLKPTVKDAVYYVNDLEYVASPLWNLESDHLDITPEWLADLVAFRDNGHQTGLMVTAVEQMFRGTADALVGVEMDDTNPATFFHFPIDDPVALEATLDLPDGVGLAPIALLDGDTPGDYLTLAVFDEVGSPNGTRAEWSVYTDAGNGRPPNRMVVDVMTERASFDPYTVVNLPSVVEHDLTEGTIATRLSSPRIDFAASFDTASTELRALSLDWIEAGDRVCRPNGICDRWYYDAETLDVPVATTTVAVHRMATPWDAFVDTTAALVFARTSAQQYAVKRWYDLDVPIDELPFAGLADPTHAVSGDGELIGRQSDVADSTYSYRGDARVDGDRIIFALDQQIENALGIGHIFTTGTFDLTTGDGTQTVVDCQGPALLCSDVENGSSAFFAARDIDASNPDVITWRVDVVVDLGNFGIADSESRLTATRGN